MFRGILAFVVLTVIIMMSIAVFRQLSGKEIWSLVKLLTYSAVCATMSLGIILMLVIIF